MAAENSEKTVFKAIIRGTGDLRMQLEMNGLRACTAHHINFGELKITLTNGKV